MRYYLLLLVTNRIIILLTESRLTEQKHLTVRQTECISIRFSSKSSIFSPFFIALFIKDYVNVFSLAVILFSINISQLETKHAHAVYHIHLAVLLLPTLSEYKHFLACSICSRCTLSVFSGSSGKLQAIIIQFSGTKYTNKRGILKAQFHK